MKAFIRNSILIVFLTGCGDPSVLAGIVYNITEIVKSQTGKEPKDLKHTCEHEWSADKKKLLLLCEFEI